MKMILKRKLMDDIFVVTARIQVEYPELYVNLRETPLFLSTDENEINMIDFEQYLESLNLQLAAFQKAATTIE